MDVFQYGSERDGLLAMVLRARALRIQLAPHRRLLVSQALLVLARLVQLLENGRATFL